VGHDEPWKANRLHEAGLERREAMMRFIGWLALLGGLACACYGAVIYLGIITVPGKEKGDITFLAIGGVVAVVGLILGAMGGKSKAAGATSGGSVVHHHHHDDRYGHDHHHHHHHDDDDRRREAEAEAPADDGGGYDGGGDDGGGGDE
jgi:hypothetical protein